jgi:hypothetical protein
MLSCPYKKSVAARKMRLDPESPELQVGDSDSVRKIWNSKLLQTAAHKNIAQISLNIEAYFGLTLLWMLCRRSSPARGHQSLFDAVSFEAGIKIEYLVWFEH